MPDDYVSRKWLIEEYHRCHQGPTGGALRIIEEAPAADVAPVRHAYWESAPGKMLRFCSGCWADEPYKFADENAKVYDYCPHCGAKMDKEEDDD